MSNETSSSYTGLDIQVLRFEKSATDDQIIQALNKVAQKFECAHDGCITYKQVQVLFEQVGIQGDRLDYYNPMNSYIHQVNRIVHDVCHTLTVRYRSSKGSVGILSPYL